MTEKQNQLNELRKIVADVLEIDSEEVTDTGDFVEDYEADSLLAIEILARIEKKWDVDIPQSELPEMRNLELTRNVVARYAQW